MAKPTGSGLGSSSRSRSRSISYTSSSAPSPKKSSDDEPTPGRSPPPQSNDASPPPSFVTYKARIQSLVKDSNRHEEAIEIPYHCLGAVEIHKRTHEARITELELEAQVLHQRIEVAKATKARIEAAEAAKQRANAIKAILVSLFG
ncbi:unnamed protein product [Lactuca virosa]|uniref:Uncharacterized protein n=1 Tax=Lactuca virosa TaxID=75947 RepID=A0AAU9PI87_9ASTR|nr:unnamed protein product [Lactuca virosa]